MSNNVPELLPFDEEEFNRAFARLTGEGADEEDEEEEEEEEQEN